MNWINKDEDEIDDQFYVKRQMLAPLCSTAWEYKQQCNKKCQRIGLKEERESWKRADCILLAVQMGFGALMGGLIWRKRQQMSIKEALLEQAAIHAAGLQIAHVLGVAALIVLVITVVALLGLKNLALGLILIIDLALFGYLLKVTYDKSLMDTVIGPDGEVIAKADSEDSDEGSKASSAQPEALDKNNGTYMLPTIA